MIKFLAILTVLSFLNQVSDVRGQDAAEGTTKNITGKWTGNVNLTQARGNRLTLPLDFTLQQNQSDIVGTLSFQFNGNVRTAPTKGIFDQDTGDFTLLVEFGPLEHGRMHLTLTGQRITGSALILHDTPKSWGADEEGPVVLTKVNK